jgi:hypothetical protein
LQIARKLAISLLACVLVFAGVCVFAFTNLFNIIETRFYDRVVLNNLEDELTSYTDFIDSYLNELRQRFSDILRENAVKSSFWVNQNQQDIYERGRIFAALSVSLPGLQWARFVDPAGNRIHYSTNPDDQILTDGETVVYKNYYETAGYIPFDQQMISGVSMRRIVFDEEGGRLIFYYPFYDSMDIHRGEAMFAVSTRAFSEHITKSARIKMADDISIVSNPDGVVIGIPPMEIIPVKKAVASVWKYNAAESGAAKSGAMTMSRVYIPDSRAMALLSAKTSQGVFVGLIVSENLFSFPSELKALLIASIFTTLFVVFFLITNIKPDAVAVVQNRLKELQVSLMHEYYQLMGDMDWAVWRRELEQRREDVKNELCRGIKVKKGGDIESYINSFFNRSWDGLLAAIGSRTGMITTFDEAKLEAILNRVLSAAKPSGVADYDYEFQTSRTYVDNIEEFENAEEDVLSYDIFDNAGGTAAPPQSAPGAPAADSAAGAPGAYDMGELPEEPASALAPESAEEGSGYLEELPEVPDFDDPAVGGSGDPEKSGVESAEFPGQDFGGKPLCVYSPKTLYAESLGSGAPRGGAPDERGGAAVTGGEYPGAGSAEEPAGEAGTLEPVEQAEQLPKESPLFNTAILEEDPFEGGGLRNADKNSHGGPSDIPLYGEFIYGDPKAGAESEAPPEDNFDLNVVSPSVLFSGKNSRESVIKNRNGINYINTEALKKSNSDTNNIDPQMKILVESVLGNPSAN